MRADLARPPAGGPVTSERWTRARADDRYRHLLPSSRCARNNFAALGLFLRAAICMRKHNECFVLAVGRQSWSSKVDVWQSFPEAMSALKKKEGVAFLHVKSMRTDNEALER